MFAKLMHHLNVGAQKKIVLGPAGWFQNAASLDAMVAPSLGPSLSRAQVSFLATHVARARVTVDVDVVSHSRGVLGFVFLPPQRRRTC